MADGIHRTIRFGAASGPQSGRSSPRRIGPATSAATELRTSIGVSDRSAQGRVLDPRADPSEKRPAVSTGSHAPASLSRRRTRILGLLIAVDTSAP